MTPDRSLAELRVVYQCATGGAISRDFDRALESLCERFGLRFWGSGMDITSGERDLSFDRWPEDEGNA